MKVILINPFDRTVTEAEHDGSLASIYALTKCDTFTALNIDDSGGCLYLDDEGLLKDLTSQAFFKIDTHPDALAGCAMVVGTDDEGDATASPYTVEQIRAKVSWLTLGTDIHYFGP